MMNLPDFKFNAAITFSSVVTNTFLTVETVSKWANFNFPTYICLLKEEGKH
jgi:hypothetical protein